MQESAKEKYFLFFVKKPKSDNLQMDVTNPTKSPPKCIFEKEDDNYIIKIFHAKSAKSKNFVLEFNFDDRTYKLSFAKRDDDKTFIFTPSLEQKNNNNVNQMDQTKITLSKKIDYFLEALNFGNELEKLSILYEESIKLCEKKPSFILFTKIFVKVCESNFCQKLLDVFDKKLEEISQNEEIDIDELNEYKNYFSQIMQNSKEIISKYSINKKSFFGLIF